jgi:hypothetical protein
MLTGNRLFICPSHTSKKMGEGAKIEQLNDDPNWHMGAAVWNQAEVRGLRVRGILSPRACRG